MGKGVQNSPLLNVHTFQPLPSRHTSLPSPFLLAGCGVDNDDNKYMRAMRLMSGCFASLPNFKLHEHPNAFKIRSISKWPWFYLRQGQLLLFLQDPTHLVTK
ncbi:unnamed protein product [Didymodactylos carnosus]|uniref:Uncharacterized protein n=1 Tax=Didymodactylos carnosus TaxID=1234261 RepID=A0A8S2PFN0_9BILA|nr:unnamed protein product [Didymodactylos carnosus]CAF4049645.1 unnamed protein product [Didymodactylos carnosus]